MNATDCVTVCMNESDHFYFFDWLTAIVDMKPHKKPSQHQVEVGLDSLVTRITNAIDNEKKKRLLSSFQKAYYIYEGAGYNVKKYKGLYEELK
jgi:hypothetical protein